MKPFNDSTKTLPGLRLRNTAPISGDASDAEHCAALLLETVPQIMRAMRLAINGLNAPLTVPQFRTMHFVQSHLGPSLSATSEFLGLSLPSTSKLVDHLVRAGLVARDNDASDRRRMTLRLTAKGDALLQGAQALVRQRLAEMLQRFGTMDLVVLQRALGLLRESFPAAPVGGATSFPAESSGASPGRSLVGNNGNGTKANSESTAVSQKR